MAQSKPLPYTGVSFSNAIYNPAFNASSDARGEWLGTFQRYGIDVLRVWCQWDNACGFVAPAPEQHDVRGRSRLWPRDSTDP